MKTFYRGITREFAGGRKRPELCRDCRDVEPHWADRRAS